jgi:acyl-CoA synthetase (NDP forming)
LFIFSVPSPIDYEEIDIMSTASEIIPAALDLGHSSLDEHTSKLLLAEYNVPVNPERIVSSEDEAVAAAHELGYPVVLKACGPQLAHKSEQGLVHLNLDREHAVRLAYRSVVNKAGPALHSALVQNMLSGRREFVAGMFRDSQFGPVIMFGLGGVYTEALADISFRVAPVSPRDAREMIHEIKSSSLLGSLRGDEPVHEEKLVHILTGLSRLAQEWPQVEEIDINPLLILSNGEPIAVDALAVLSSGREAIDRPQPIQPSALVPLFSPSSVAFVGASGTMGKWGHMLPTNVISGGFRGQIYLVNPKGGELFGRQVYSSLMDIPDDLDLVVVTIPAAKVMELIPQMQAKKVKAMVLISSGFSETGSHGATMEKELVQEARQAGIVFLGPNTMGLCNPHARFHCTGTVVHPEPGATAMVSQSGNMGVQLLSYAVQQGIGMRGFCGSGNEGMLTIEDFLKAFAQDPLTKTVMLYVESVKDGERFLKNMKRLAQKKPVILLKGGETQAGNKAAASHTGALSSNTRVFDAVCRQSGVRKVDGPLDLLHMAAAFSSLPLPRGNKVVIITLGGGWGVITADLCASYGLQVPELSADIRAEIDALLPDYWSHSNPIDLVGEWDEKLPIQVLDNVLQWDECDAVINLGILGRKIFVSRYLDAIQEVDPAYSKSFLDQASASIAAFENSYVQSVARLMTEYNKPVFGVRLEQAEGDQTVMEVEDCPYKALFYETPENAVKVCAEMYGYYNFLHNSDQ